MDGQYDHLNLTRWPFLVVPDREYCTFIADRQQLQADISSLLTTLSRRDTSSIHLFWSWYGAGKTHSLYYLANRADELNQQGQQYLLYPIYSEFPKAARSFLDLYRSLVTGLSVETLINAYLQIYTDKKSEQLRKELMLSSPDLVNALHAMTTGESQEHVTAIRWLRAESLPISEFRRIGVSLKINSSEEAIRIISALVAILAVAARLNGNLGSRVIWLLDEFQRVESTGSRALNEINAGLHSTFNACPRGLSIFFSFSGRPQPNSPPPWLNRELRDRIGQTKVIILPPMLPEEALGFVRDVFAQFRTPNFTHENLYFPFTEQTCKVIIEDIRKKGELKPRAIMEAFNAVLEVADPKIENKEMSIINPEFAKRVLATHISFSADEET
jgi:hypothetical protein